MVRPLGPSSRQIDDGAYDEGSRAIEISKQENIPVTLTEEEVGTWRDYLQYNEKAQTIAVQEMLSNPELVPTAGIVIDDMLVSKTASTRASETTTDQPDRIDEALTLYARTIARHPLRQAAWNEYAWLFYLKAITQNLPVEQEGLNAALRAVELAPGRREAIYTLTLIYIQNGDLEQAAQSALRLKQIEPSTASAVDAFLETL